MTKRPSKIDNHFSPGSQLDAGLLYRLVFAVALLAMVLDAWVLAHVLAGL